MFITLVYALYTFTPSNDNPTALKYEINPVTFNTWSKNQCWKQLRFVVGFFWILVKKLVEWNSGAKLKCTRDVLHCKVRNFGIVSCGSYKLTSLEYGKPCSVQGS